jgi:hypothetical protein
VLERFRRELGLMFAWLIFPLIPVVLEDTHFGISSFGFLNSAGTGPDPYVWNWFIWVLVLGPLVGYGFLAGATISVRDNPSPRRGWRRLLGRRAVWVAIGPWWGAIACVAIYFGLASLDQLFPGSARRVSQIQQPWTSTWAYGIVSWAITILLVVLWAYSWLWPAWAALRRSARIGQWKRSIVHGIVTAAAFVGSLFGSFWVATAVWRSYFFDPRIVRLLIVAVGLTVASGCASTITYGEVRRRELFHAMLVAWVLGLALMWRWWSRPRPGRPPALH